MPDKPNKSAETPASFEENCTADLVKKLDASPRMRAALLVAVKKGQDKAHDPAH